MPTVYQFPPVRVVAYENTINDPMSISVGISGAIRGSQTRANRSVYAATVLGNGDGAGYVEALKRLMAGKLPLVQVDTLPAHWWGYRRGDSLGGREVAWTSGADDLEWTEGASDLLWLDATPLAAVAGNDGFDYIDVEGIESGLTIQIGEAIQIGSADALSLRKVTSDGGTTRIYLSGPLADGFASIGRPVSKVFSLKDRPRTTQTSGTFVYNFDMIEALESDFADEFEVVDPWI